jgi:hypothetical protein
LFVRLAPLVRLVVFEEARLVDVARFGRVHLLACLPVAGRSW